MKSIAKAFVVIAVLVAISGCASLAGTFGLASKSYVDEQLEVVRSELKTDVDRTASIARENTEALKGYGETAAQLEELIVSIQQTVQTTDELKALADILEKRLENLPVETIRQLVGILNEYLENR